MVIRRQALLRAVALAAVALLPALGCQQGDTAVLSPAADNHPPAESSDGRVVGADDKSPQHLLAEQGTTAHPAPGWKVDANGVAYDPKRRAEESDPGSTKLVHPDAGTEILPKQTKPAPTPAMPEE